MSIDLFSEAWADMPVIHPGEGSNLRGLAVPDVPQPIQEVGPKFVDLDSNHLAFTAQTRFYGHTSPALEPTKVNGAGRQFFDKAAVVALALSMLDRPHHGETDLSLELWRDATAAARESGTKGKRVRRLEPSTQTGGDDAG